MTRTIVRRPTAQRISTRAQLLEHIKSCPGLSTRDLAELVGDKSPGCANTKHDIHSLATRVKVSGRNDGGFTWVDTVRKAKAKTMEFDLFQEPSSNGGHGMVVNGTQRALAAQQVDAVQAAATAAVTEPKREVAVADYNSDAVTGAAPVHLIKAGILKVVTT